jgi:hypothetical protein
MNRRSVLRSLVVWLGAVAAVGLLARPAHAYYYYYTYRFHYYVHRNRRRLRWRNRRGR